jgi:MFS family permease
VVSRWFTTSRGKALGVAAIGASVGGMLVPMLLQHWIDLVGWRASLQYLAACIGFLLLPLLLIVMRDHPEVKGLQPEGAEGLPAPDAHAVSSREWSNADILRNVSFWLIGGCLGLLFMAFTSVMSNLAAYASGLGVGGPATATLISVIAFCGVLGKLIFGYAADRISLRLELWLALALAGVGILVLSLEPAYGVMLVAGVVMGLAAGGMLPVWGAMIASVFGVVSYGRVMGLMTPVIALLMMPGPQIAGALFDASDSYRLAMRLFVGVLVLAACLLLPLKIPSPEPARE